MKPRLSSCADRLLLAQARKERIEVTNGFLEALAQLGAWLPIELFLSNVDVRLTLLGVVVG